MALMSPIRTDPEVVGGQPWFAGTRVPVTHLFEFLKEGDPLDEFLRQFPTVEREQAVAVLGMAKRSY
ncbi:MAG: hypothetical protein JWO31_1439 [Phycisphaerales bacterium]|nr:hypothetical protein [Phycisphaerales bacterium]